MVILCDKALRFGQKRFEYSQIMCQRIRRIVAIVSGSEQELKSYDVENALFPEAVTIHHHLQVRVDILNRSSFHMQYIEKYCQNFLCLSK